jgi:hypothetical protein
MVKNPQYPFKISDYLNLVIAIKTLPKKDTWTFYDVEADVLYINFHQPALRERLKRVTGSVVRLRQSS